MSLQDITERDSPRLFCFAALSLLPLYLAQMFVRRKDQQLLSEPAGGPRPSPPLLLDDGDARLRVIYDGAFSEIIARDAHEKLARARTANENKSSKPVIGSILLRIQSAIQALESGNSVPLSCYYHVLRVLLRSRHPRYLSPCPALLLFPRTYTV